MPLITSSYRPPRLLKGGHRQTFYAALCRRVPKPSYIRERFITADHDFLDLDWARIGSDKLTIISHGLEGSTDQRYVRGMVRALNRNGWDALAWNFRGCSGEVNRYPHSYHSGATADLQAVIGHALQKGYSRLSLVGFSLGGNMTLKYLGEEGDEAPQKIDSAVAVSVPCHLESASRQLALPSNRVYMTRFLLQLGQKIRLKKKLMPGQIDNSGYWRIKNFKEFDDRYTAPLHGFKDAQDYWQRSSSVFYLKGIHVRTLLLNAQDDPFLAPESFPSEEAKNHPYLFLETPETGGHVGFVDFNQEGLYWSERRALEFLGI